MFTALGRPCARSTSRPVPSIGIDHMSSGWQLVGGGRASRPEPARAFLVPCDACQRRQRLPAGLRAREYLVKEVSLAAERAQAEEELEVPPQRGQHAELALENRK